MPGDSLQIRLISRLKRLKVIPRIFHRRQEPRTCLQGSSTIQCRLDLSTKSVAACFLAASQPRRCARSNNFPPTKPMSAPASAPYTQVTI